MNFADNIEKVYNQSTDADLITGRLWYRSAREVAHRIGNGDYFRGAGILASLSPQISWKRNVQIAADGVARNGKFSEQFGPNKEKAKRIFDGENPDRVLGGMKTRAFYAQIISGGTSPDVCIDRHALAVALGREATLKERKRLERPKSYAVIAQAYTSAAIRLGLLPGELQAITWVTWRRLKGIVE